MVRDRRRNGRQRLALMAVAALAVLAGCRGGGDKKAPEKGGVEENLGFETAGILQRQTLVENLVRDCMKEQGFDYTPVDPAAERAALVGSATLKDEDFERQFGYGITTLYEQRRREASRGLNADYRTSLSPAERTAYDKALYGKNVGTTFSQAVDTGDFAELGGCTKKATEEAFGGGQILTTLQTKLDELDTRIESDPRMVKAITDWAGCMRDTGQPRFEKPDDVDGYLQDKLEEIVGPATRVGVGGAGTTPNYDRAQLVKLQKEEVAIVKADLECEEKHIEPVEKGVRAEYERTFSQENADFLATVRKP